MSNFYKKYGRYVAMLIALVIIISTLVVTTGGLIPTKINKVNDQTDTDDRKTADEISNMTGVKVEEILNLKNSGKTWNEILESLKSRIEGTNQADSDRRNQLLSETNLDKEYIQKLKEEGFTDQEITQAKMLVERVIFQLNEITNLEEDASNINISDTTNINEDKQDIAQYIDLKGKIDIKITVRLLLKLQKDFGSMEKVMDEYLYSLQAGINLELYIIDKKAYEKQKEEKGSKVDSQKLITLAKIEEKMLEKIQKDNNKKKDKTSSDIENLLNPSNEPADIKEKDDTPKVPLPDVSNNRIKGPNEEEMQEINAIRNRSLGIPDLKEGR